MTKLHKLILITAMIVLFFGSSQSIQAGKPVTQHFSDTSQMIYFPLHNQAAVLWVKDRFYYSKKPLVASDWEKLQIKFTRTDQSEWSDIEEWMPLAFSFKGFDYAAIFTDLYTETESLGWYGEIWRLNRKQPDKLTLALRSPEGSTFNQLFIFEESLCALSDRNELWVTKDGKHWSELKHDLQKKSAVQITIVGDKIYASTSYALYSSGDLRHWDKISWEVDKNYISKIASVNETLFVLATNAESDALYMLDKENSWTEVLSSNKRKEIEDIQSVQNNLYIVQANFRDDLSDPRGSFKDRIYYLLKTQDGVQFDRIYQGKHYPETILSVGEKILFLTTKNYHTYIYRP